MVLWIEVINEIQIIRNWSSLFKRVLDQKSNQKFDQSLELVVESVLIKKVL